MSSKRASVNPLAGFLKPQSPAERLTAQHRDREKLQRERQLKELQEEEAKARGRSSRGRGKRKGRGCDEEARGAPMHAARSKSKPPPLTAPSDPSFGASTQS